MSMARLQAHQSWSWLLPSCIVGALRLASDLRISPSRERPLSSTGPFASLLAASTDLGPARGDHVQLTAMLHDHAGQTA